MGLAISVAAAAWAHEAHKPKAATPEAKAPAAEGKAEMQTLQGELVDMNCYMAHEGKGEKHKKCADACISEGAPMGLLTQDGMVYLLLADHTLKEPYESLKEKAAEQVGVKGEIHQRGGVQALLVKGLETAK